MDTVFLRISAEHKTIPYCAENRQHSINHGFILLKGNPDSVNDIPEVQDDKILKQSIININASHTPFFTVGCEKSYNNSPEGRWVKGYIEISFNHPEIAFDAVNYFNLFYEFNDYAQRANCDSILFDFELMRAHFTKTGTSGYTITAWISTSYFPTNDDAIKSWEEGVAFFSNFLANFEKPDLPIIYE